MNSLRIVKNAEGVNGVVLSNQCVLLIEETEEKLEGYSYQKYFMYNLETNTKVEIAPNIPKLNIVKIKDINKFSEYVYFSFFFLDEEDIEVRIFRYSIKEKNCKNIYAFTDKFEKYKNEQKTKIYVLNEYYLLIQNQILRMNLTESYEGYLDFELSMYNILQKETIKIMDENLTSNGIADIMLISENVCVLKTGYSLIEDDRYKLLEKEEVSVESISFVNLGQLVSDIIISKSNIVMNTIDQTFYTDTIPYFKVKGDYLIYSKYNFEQKEETVVYYNYAEKKKYVCINKSDTEEIKLANTIIFNKKPYIMVDTAQGIEFYNILDKKTDFIFNNHGKFECAVNDIIIGSSTKKGLFGKNKEYISVYKYPGLSLVHSEKGKFLGCITDGFGKTYILTKKG